MPKLVLKFDDRILSECGIGLLGVTIGRLPDNTIVIDNPAVSSHHARVVRDGDTYVVEDLHSTNGTFVNETLITRHTLRDGDIVLVGKHTLLFDQRSAAEITSVSPAPSIPALGGTRVLDTEHHRALLAKWEKEHQGKQAASVASAPAPATPAAATPAIPKATPPAPPVKVGVLRVLAGRAEQSEYSLVAQTSMIGKAETSLVRLKGWFKPKVAAAIARKGEVYAVTSLSAKTLVNGQRVTGRQELKDGDVLQVGGLTLEFRLKR